MYKIILLAAVIILRPVPSTAQQAVIDSAAVSAWPSVHAGSISPDGKYVSYEIEVFSHIGYTSVVGQRRVIKEVAGSWTMELNGPAGAPVFAKDSKRMYVTLPGDTLLIIAPGKGIIGYQAGINSISQQGHYLFFRLKKHAAALGIIDVETGQQHSVEDVGDYYYSAAKNRLLLVSAKQNNLVTLSWYTFREKTKMAFWEGAWPDQVLLSPTGQQVILRKQQQLTWVNKDQQPERTKLPDSLDNVELTGWTPGKQVIFTAERKILRPVSPVLRQPADLTIWDYRDKAIPYGAPVETMPANKVTGIVNLADGKPAIIAGSGETVLDFTGQFALVKTGPSQLSIVALSNGASIKTITGEPALFSPTGKYLLYFYKGHYYCYRLQTGETFNLTAMAGGDRLPFIRGEEGITCWLEQDSAVILSNGYDLWQFDPSGRRAPYCITAGQGFSHKIRLAPLRRACGHELAKGNVLPMTGFDEQTKRSGFYRVKIGAAGKPELLNQDDYYYFSPLSGPVENAFDAAPIKAEAAPIWLVKRMKASASPNYCVTKDFIHFEPVSSIYPERGYEWYTTTLYTWPVANEKKLQGILYKPTHFNPEERYPLIVHYYDTFSRNLAAYLEPGASIGPINIAWMVSRGYLVFVPDIDFVPGKTGESCYDAIVSAADFLSKQPFIDSTKIGIQGHSFGGFQTYYLVTHTTRFAAACVSSGVSDMISFTGGVCNGRSGHLMANTGQINLQATLWENRQRYIEHSPVLFANRINTPLLAMHTTEDGAAPVAQGIEMFQAMQQLQKTGWLLLYKDENHVLRKPENSLDYTRRQVQFFDHYLKGAPLPDWMKIK